MGFGITFSPLVPNEILWAALAVALIVAALLLVIRSRGAWIRAVALGLAALALANPSLTREDRDPLSSIAAVIVDKSPSQEFGDRQKQTEAVRAALAERLGRMPGIEVRFVEAGQADGETDGTRLFAALSSALSDVPHDRVAGALFITDGRVHDVPSEAAALGFAAAGLGMASEDLAKKNGCMGCHDVAKKKAGPAFKDVAAKYKGQADAEGKLVAELGAGKKHPKTAASEADRKTLVKWVLSQ